jgi:hypothetical protein
VPAFRDLYYRQVTRYGETGEDELSQQRELELEKKTDAHCTAIFLGGHESEPVNCLDRLFIETEPEPPYDLDI